MHIPLSPRARDSAKFSSRSAGKLWTHLFYRVLDAQHPCTVCWKLEVCGTCAWAHGYLIMNVPRYDASQRKKQLLLSSPTSLSHVLVTPLPMRAWLHLTQRTQVEAAETLDTGGRKVYNVVVDMRRPRDKPRRISKTVKSNCSNFS